MYFSRIRGSQTSSFNYVFFSYSIFGEPLSRVSFLGVVHLQILLFKIFFNSVWVGISNVYLEALKHHNISGLTLTSVEKNVRKQIPTTVNENTFDPFESGNKRTINA